MIDDNEDDRPVHEVTREMLEARLQQIFHSPKAPPMEVDPNWEHKVRIYSFLYRANPEHAEKWAKAARYLAGYRD